MNRFENFTKPNAYNLQSVIFISESYNASIDTTSKIKQSNEITLKLEIKFHVVALGGTCVPDDNLLINKNYKTELQASLEEHTRLVKNLHGPTATDPNIQALIVSYATPSGADQVDQICIINGFNISEIFVIDLID
ncbi:uncharacterized protein MELLADRAFT_114565 [Melampsora larici-populina 98AG31]|uniref:Uncharacterized protein n=1 Tax=Melampsora larici-populina (strain 98AG31 / pathotype 3-4-7) TaxID=747676 RepID=F4SDZ0_MELLP|nr:uncharacterized protein MELLADRAFT_114565 [Melampsora larici-populina 98AG31]EGF97136.1 hypothetical protein MELLADRAFT_114565 [Melampsora larici-populina 98AG31]